MLAEQLRALLEAHGPANLLRAMSASALGLAENAAADDDQWINVAAATAQAAEALTDDDQTVVDDAAGEESEEEEEDETAPSEAVDSGATTPPPSPPSSRSSEGADMRDQEFAPRKDATQWRAYRLSEDGKKSIPLFWGDDGVERSQWARKEFSTEAIRRRWGVGRYVIWWYGMSEEGKLVSLGRGHELRIVERPSEVHEPEPQRAAPAPTGGGSSSDLLAALSAMRPSAPAAVGGGTDMTVVLQILAFMEDSRDRQNRVAEARLQAEREIMMERERIASKERIAQLEASAHAVGRGGRGVDTEALAEVIGRKVQEVIEGSGDDDDSAALTTRSSDVATMVNAFKETIAPLVTMFVQNAMANKPGGNGSNGSN